MAIFKKHYRKHGQAERSLAKASIRYIRHRRVRGGGKLPRALFGSDGLTGKQAVYALIDAARRGTAFYKCMRNPAPEKEDTDKDLELERITRQTILALEERFDHAGKEATPA